MRSRRYPLRILYHQRLCADSHFRGKKSLVQSVRHVPNSLTVSRPRYYAQNKLVFRPSPRMYLPGLPQQAAHQGTAWEDRSERQVPVWQRQEIQEMPRFLTAGHGSSNVPR